MIVGSIGRANITGLSTLLKSYYDNGIIQKVIVELHPTDENQTEWFKSEDRLEVGPNEKQEFRYAFQEKDRSSVVNFIEGIDVLLMFEIPFYWEIIDIAKKLNKKTVLIPMYECTPIPIDVDHFLCINELDYHIYKQAYPNKKVSFSRNPSNSNVIWRQRERARKFVHNAGYHFNSNRNGTLSLIDSLKYIKSPIELVIRSTKKIDLKIDDDRVTLTSGPLDFKSIWDDGDVFIMPEKHNALCLPLEEAYSAGMLVMAGNRFPNNFIFPKDPLIPVSEYRQNLLTSVVANEAYYDPKEIAKTIDDWYDRDITSYSNLGKAWKEENDWSKIKNNLLKILES
jgi:hypothetical protein